MDYGTQFFKGDQNINFGFAKILNVLPGNLLWGGLILLALLTGVVTLVLYYHWLRYGFGDRMVILAQVLYTLVVLACFIIMISSIEQYGQTPA